MGTIVRTESDGMWLRLWIEREVADLMYGRAKLRDLQVIKRKNVTWRQF
jgi:hypothetical protein